MNKNIKWHKKKPKRCLFWQYWYLNIKANKLKKLYIFYTVWVHRRNIKNGLFTWFWVKLTNTENGYVIFLLSFEFNFHHCIISSVGGHSAMLQCKLHVEGLLGLKNSKKRDISSFQRIGFDWQIYTKHQIWVIIIFLLMFIEIALQSFLLLL